MLQYSFIELLEYHYSVIKYMFSSIFLRDALEPLFSERDMSFQSHSVFLDASNTPLPLAFDTFPMGGNTLHVRGLSCTEIYS